jgi:hypothetical protein
MNSKISKSVVGGIIGTAIMTLIMYIAPMMGMPKMSPPEMLAGMMGLPIIVGWMMHFMIGIMFALGYVFFFSPIFKIENNIISGAMFGVAVFVFAQVMMMVMSKMMGGMEQPEGSPILMMVGSMMGHIIYGIGVSLTVKK